MARNKYAIYNYWDNKAFKRENVWAGLFDNQPIKRESVIINSVVMNGENNQCEDSWAVYPNIYAVLGFLQYVYLPTAFSAFVLEDVTGGYYMSSDLGEDFEALKSEYPHKQLHLDKMIQVYDELTSFWDLDESDCLSGLKEWVNKLNDNFSKSKFMLHSFHLFTSPQETIKYLIQAYEEDLTIENLESDTGFTKGQLLDISKDDIYENEFQKRNFIRLLNGRLRMVI